MRACWHIGHLRLRSQRQLARRYDLNPLVARLLAVAGAVVLTPLVYVAAWILMPNDAEAAPSAA